MHASRDPPGQGPTGEGAGGLGLGSGVGTGAGVGSGQGVGGVPSQGFIAGFVDSKYGSPAKLQVYMASKPRFHDPFTFGILLHVGSLQSSIVVVVVWTLMPVKLAFAASGTNPVNAVSPSGQGTTVYETGLFQ